MEKLAFSVIATAESSFLEKFGAPRQSGLVPEAQAVIRFSPHLAPALWKEALTGLGSFSHVWITWAFHQTQGEWKTLVRPPRLGGAEKVGVFASRSPHRPAPIGLSAVRLEEISPRGDWLRVSGVDFVNGTPILDIRPYVPYADALPQASAGWAPPPESRAKVVFSAEARSQIQTIGAESGDSRLSSLIENLLAQNPTPAFQAGDSGHYALRLRAGVGGVHSVDFDLHFEQIAGGGFEVRELRRLSP